MARRISPIWIRDRKEEVEKNQFVSVTTSYSPAARWLVEYLDFLDKPVKVINVGAGVKKIMLAEKVCPHCKGKGCLK